MNMIRWANQWGDALFKKMVERSVSALPTYWKPHQAEPAMDYQYGHHHFLSRCRVDDIAHNEFHTLSYLET